MSITNIKMVRGGKRPEYCGCGKKINYGSSLPWSCDCDSNKINMSTYKDMSITNTWEENFRENYDENNISEWTLGIIASAMLHTKIEKVGTNASHITRKLRELVAKEISKAKEESRAKTCEEIVGLLDAPPNWRLSVKSYNPRSKGEYCACCGFNPEEWQSKIKSLSQSKENLIKEENKI